MDEESETNEPGGRLSVLDLGEIVDDETLEVYATFDPKPGNVARWEAWVGMINAALDALEK